MPYPFGPSFVPVYDDQFSADRRNLGLGARNFDTFFESVERQILDYPWIFSKEVPESGGTLMRETKEVQPDLPPLYVYYKVSAEDERIRFLGLSPAWSKTDVF